MSELFSSETDIILPGSNNDNSSNYKDLMTTGIEDAITKKEIKPVLVESATDIECPAYLLDMTNVQSITQHSLTAIKGLLSGKGTAVYIKNGSTIMRVGYADDNVLYTVLDVVVREMYNRQCEVYINRGRGFELMKGTEVDMVRLNL